VNNINPVLKIKNQRGISLIELILVVVAVGVLAVLIASLPASIQSIRNSGNTSLAKEIANKEIDLLRKQPYSGLSNGMNTFTDASLFKLPSPAAQYEVSDCPIEVCASGEVAKKIKVTVFWQEAGVVKKVELSTLMTERGLGQ
jgi:type II secretory pathway pseudopilin PulG